MENSILDNVNFILGHPELVLQATPEERQALTTLVDHLTGTNPWPTVLRPEDAPVMPTFGKVVKELEECKRQLVDIQYHLTRKYLDCCEENTALRLGVEERERERDDFSRVILAVKGQRDVVTQRVDKYKSALEFYANSKNYVSQCLPKRNMHEKARAALAGEVE